jgi:hypothetical protein
MKRTVFWALVALNVVLLAGLIAPYLRSNAALAQRPAASGRRPELLMIPGEIVGGNSAVVYLIDTANRRMGAISLNNRGSGLDVLEPQPLEQIFKDRAMEEGPEKKDGKKAGGKR